MKNKRYLTKTQLLPSLIVGVLLMRRVPQSSLCVLLYIPMCCITRPLQVQSNLLNQILNSWFSFSCCYHSTNNRTSSTFLMETSDMDVKPAPVQEIVANCLFPFKQLSQAHHQHIKTIASSTIAPTHAHYLHTEAHNDIN